MRDRQEIKDDGAKIEKLILEVLLDIRGLLEESKQSTILDTMLDEFEFNTQPIEELIEPIEVKPKVKKRKKRKIKTV